MLPTPKFRSSDFQSNIFSCSYYYWRVPKLVYEIKVTLVGGGGAGGGACRGTGLYLRGGGGGGGSATILNQSVSVIPGDIITILVGGGGRLMNRDKMDGEDGYKSAVHYGPLRIEANPGFGGKGGLETSREGGQGGAGGQNACCPNLQGDPGQSGTILPPSFGISNGGDGGASGMGCPGGVGGSAGSGGNSYFGNGARAGRFPFGQGQPGTMGSGGGGSAPVLNAPLEGGPGGNGMVLIVW